MQMRRVRRYWVGQGCGESGSTGFATGWGRVLISAGNLTSVRGIGRQMALAGVLDQRGIGGTAYGAAGTKQGHRWRAEPNWAAADVRQLSRDMISVVVIRLPGKIRVARRNLSDRDRRLQPVRCLGELNGKPAGLCGGPYPRVRLFWQSRPPADLYKLPAQLYVLAQWRRARQYRLFCRGDRMWCTERGSRGEHGCGRFSSRPQMGINRPAGFLLIGGGMSELRPPTLPGLAVRIGGKQIIKHYFARSTRSRQFLSLGSLNTLF